MKYTSTIIASGSGSIAGCTYSRNRFGSYIRQRAIPVNPNSVFQSVVRALFSQLTIRWNSVLTPAQRSGWDSWAAATPGVSPNTGLNAYVAANAARQFSSGVILDTPPTLYNLAELTAPALLSAVAATQLVSTTFNNADPWANEIDGWLNVFIGRPRSPSINFFKGPYRFASAVAGSSPVPPTSPAAVTSPFTFAVGQRIFIRWMAVRADGRYSVSVVDSIIAT